MPECLITIADDGSFSRAAAQLVKDGFFIPYVELWTEGGKAKAKKKAASKTKYTCPDCGLNAWGKPEIRIACVECETELEAED